MKTVWRILLPLLSILCLIFIFHNSLQDAVHSEERSKGIVNTVSDGIEHTTNQTVSQDLRSDMGKVIRKVAHVAEYGALGFFVTLSIFAWLGKVGAWSFASLGFGALTGAVDEFLQGFTKGRYPAFSDVLLDELGVVAGLAAALLVVFFITRRRKKYELGLSVS